MDNKEALRIQYKAFGLQCLEVIGKNIFRPAYEDDVGHNLAASVDQGCPPGRITWVGTDTRINVPRGLWCMITARSSMHKKNILVPMGVIDAGYQGELFVPVCPLEAFYMVRAGEQIAQAIFLPVVHPEFLPVETFTPSSRGTNGFGSTTK